MFTEQARSLNIVQPQPNTANMNLAQPVFGQNITLPHPTFLFVTCLVQWSCTWCPIQLLQDHEAGSGPEMCDVVCCQIRAPSPCGSHLSVIHQCRQHSFHTGWVVGSLLRCVSSYASMPINHAESKRRDWFDARLDLFPTFANRGICRTYLKRITQLETAILRTYQ